MNLQTVRPINNELIEHAKAASQPDAKAPEQRVIDKLLSEWMKYNSIRISIAAVAWTLGTATLFLA
jgi:uncharacterized membrane protein